MKDDLSLGDAQPRAPCPLLRHVRLEGLSLTFVLAIVWGAGGQMLGNTMGPGCGRGRAAVRVSWFMRLFEPCLWNQLVPAGFSDVFIECKEILYSELKWSDVLHSQEKCSFNTALARCCAMWWIDMIHEMWHVSFFENNVRNPWLILGLLVWKKRKEDKSVYCRKFSKKKIRELLPHMLLLHNWHFLSQKLLVSWSSFCAQIMCKRSRWMLP